MKSVNLKKIGIRVLVGSLSLAAMFAALLSFPEQAGAAFEYAAPLPSSCVEGFWDSQLYGWRAFRNNCGQPIYLTWIGRTSGGAFSADVPEGGKTNTGFTRSEVEEMGGFNFFVCPIHYIPVDASGEQVSSAYSNYRCRRD